MMSGPCFSGWQSALEYSGMRVGWNGGAALGCQAGEVGLYAGLNLGELGLRGAEAGPNA